MKLCAEAPFSFVHCTTVIKSIQMKKAVDKKISDQIPVGNPKQFCLSFHLRERNKHLAGRVVEREAQDICRLVFLSVGAVKCARASVTNENEAQIVCFAEHGRFHALKRQARWLAFGGISDRNLRHYRPRFRGVILPSLESCSYFLRFLRLRSARFFCTYGDAERLWNRMSRMRRNIPDCCTRFVNRRIVFPAFSVPFFCTCTFTGIARLLYHTKASSAMAYILLR